MLLRQVPFLSEEIVIGKIALFPQLVVAAVEESVVVSGASFRVRDTITNGNLKPSITAPTFFFRKNTRRIAVVIFLRC